MSRVLCPVTSKILILVFAIAALAPVPRAVFPRKSPELTIAEPSGRKIPLSTFKGKVVAIEFFFIQSDHCIRVAKTLNKLNVELGARGFQAVGIVFDPPNASATGRLIPSMVSYFKLTYPVGFATKSEVDAYLGRSGKEILSIPQIIVIDRAGMIRAVSGAGNPALEDVDSLRTMIDGLLAEKHPMGASLE